MITYEFDGSNIRDNLFQSSLWDSPLVVGQPGVETPGYYQHAGGVVALFPMSFPPAAQTTMDETGVIGRIILRLEIP